MRSLILLCLFVAVAFAAPNTPGEQPETPNLHPRGCLWILGQCAHDCEEGTHGYLANCGPKTPEATCEQPNPVPEPGIMCDYSACYCDEGTVRDKTTDKCVKLEDCPK